MVKKYYQPFHCHNLINYNNNTLALKYVLFSLIFQQPFKHLKAISAYFSAYPLFMDFKIFLLFLFLPCIFLYILKALVLDHVYCIISSSLLDLFEFCLSRLFFLYLCSQSLLYIMNILFYNPGFYIYCFYKTFQLQGTQICIFIIF